MMARDCDKSPSPATVKGDILRLRNGLAMTRSKENTKLTIRQFGKASDVITLENGPVPALKPGQVRVGMKLASINPSDLITISGAYRSRTQLPFVGGFEGIGIVHEIAPDVSDIEPGMRVLPIGSMGAWQSEKIADAGWCFSVADDLDDEQAATSYINPMTAWLMLHGAAQVQPETRLAVSAAGSAIGRMILRLAIIAGLRPVAIVRREATCAELAGFELEDIVVADDSSDCTAILKSCWNGRGPDLALDAVGGSTGQSMINALQVGGHMLHYGLLSGRPLGQDRPIRRDIKFELFALRNWIHGGPTNRIANALSITGKLISEGVLSSAVAAIYPLDDYHTAFKHVEQAGRGGKILLKPRHAA
jgi:NADPH:quinone reductase-like Zn-dependent oxidoreductase